MLIGLYKSLQINNLAIMRSPQSIPLKVEMRGALIMRILNVSRILDMAYAIL
jgi:hypothetical protein